MEKAEEEGLEKKFKITSTKSLSNMVLFDKDGRLKRYNSANEIMEDFFALRLEYYQKRKVWEEIRSHAPSFPCSPILFYPGLVGQ